MACTSIWCGLNWDLGWLQVSTHCIMNWDSIVIFSRSCFGSSVLLFLISVCVHLWTMLVGRASTYCFILSHSPMV